MRPDTLTEFGRRSAAGPALGGRPPAVTLSKKNNLAMPDFPREPRVSILNDDPIADLEALNIEDPNVVSAPEIIWYTNASDRFQSK